MRNRVRLQLLALGAVALLLSLAGYAAAQGGGKDKDFGSVEKGKVADLVIVRGDVMKDISTTQNVEKVFMDGNAVDTTYTPNYRNPIPRTTAGEPRTCSPGRGSATRSPGTRCTSATGSA